MRSRVIWECSAGLLSAASAVAACRHDRLGRRNDNAGTIRQGPLGQDRSPRRTCLCVAGYSDDHPLSHAIPDRRPIESAYSLSDGTDQGKGHRPRQARQVSCDARRSHPRDPGAGGHGLAGPAQRAGTFSRPEPPGEHRLGRWIKLGGPDRLIYRRPVGDQRVPYLAEGARGNHVVHVVVTLVGSTDSGHRTVFFLHALIVAGSITSAGQKIRDRRKSARNARYYLRAGMQGVRRMSGLTRKFCAAAIALTIPIVWSPRSSPRDGWMPGDNPPATPTVPGPPGLAVRRESTARLPTGLRRSPKSMRSCCGKASFPVTAGPPSTPMPVRKPGLHAIRALVLRGVMREGEHFWPTSRTPAPAGSNGSPRATRSPPTAAASRRSPSTTSWSSVTARSDRSASAKASMPASSSTATPPTSPPPPPITDSTRPYQPGNALH